MAATQADVRRALLDAHPYKLETLDHAAEIAMDVRNGQKADAKRALRNAAKGNNPGHFGLKDRAERVIARIGAAPEEPTEGLVKDNDRRDTAEDPEEEDEDEEHAALMAETQALVDAGTQSIQEGKGVLVVTEGQDEDPGPDDEDAEGIDPFADDEPELAEDEQEAFEQAMDKNGE